MDLLERPQTRRMLSFQNESLRRTARFHRANFHRRSRHAATPTAPRPELGLAKPAVLYLKGLDRSGTGFFVTSEPDGAEIFVDDKFFGDAPATLNLSVGSHVIVFKVPGRPDWRRTLEVLKGNKTTLKTVLDPAP